MDNETIPLLLPKAMRLALDQIARHEDASLGQIIRDAIARDLQRRQAAKTTVRADERLVASLRALLADDLAFSRSWEELDSRLRAKGYALQESGGGLILNEAATGARQCKASELGYSYSQLLRRFDRPFPGHAHAHLLYRARAEVTPEAASRR